MRELVSEPAMPYAVVQDVPASWEDYRLVAAALGGDAPEGLILHAAGRTDEGFRMIDVWESREAWKTFSSTGSYPIGASAVNQPRAEPTFRELEVEHLLERG